MKKLLALLLAAVLLCTALVACNKSAGLSEDEGSGVEIEVRQLVDGDDTFTYDVNEDGKYDIISFTTKNSDPHEVEIPDEIGNIEVTGIAAEAFKAANEISKLIIPENVERIGLYAFYGCLYLEEVMLPSTLEEISTGAFDGCTALKAVTVPAGVKEIGDFAFKDCTALATVALGDGVESIGDGAFWGCTKLSEIVLPDTIKELGDGAFVHCSALAKVTVKADVEKLGKDVLAFCASELVVVTDVAETSALYQYLMAEGIKAEKPAA